MRKQTQIEEKRGRGRPSLPSGEARTILTGFKVSKREADAISKASRAEHIDKSEWMRRAVLQVIGMA
jgi:hypothetical protein